MSSENLSITWTTILAILAGVLVIMNFVDKVKSWKKPMDDRDKTINETLANHQKLLEKDNDRLKHVEQDLEMFIKSQLAIMDHLITGNGVDGLTKVRKEMQDYLVSRK